MINKIPTALWFYQAISIFSIIVHGIGAYNYVVGSSTSLTTMNLLGVALNFGAIAFISIIIVGIWKRKTFAKIGAVVYSFLLFIFTVFVSISTYSEFTPEEIHYQIGYIAFYLLFTGTFLSLPFIIWKSKHVNEFFTEPRK